MKTQRSSSSAYDDDYESLMVAYCWWRSAVKFGEAAKFRVELPNVSTLTPPLRLLREMERLALMAREDLGEIKQKLVSYRSGDFWVPTGGIKKEDMNIPPAITILLVGFSGSGKSSLINLMYSVLGRSGLIPFARTSAGNSIAEDLSPNPKCTTKFMEEHNVLRSMQSGFCVYDSRGLDYDSLGECVEQVSDWMSSNGVHHNQICLRTGESPASEDESSSSSVAPSMAGSSSKFAVRRVNCAIVVVNIAEIFKSLKKGDWKPLEATRELFRCPALKKCNENPILIMTHGDLLATEERIKMRIAVSEFLGISETTGVYDIVCLTEYGFLADESDPVTSYALSEAVYRALLISDRGHIPKTKFLDWILLVLSLIMCYMAAFFSFLARFFSKLGHKNKIRF